MHLWMSHGCMPGFPKAHQSQLAFTLQDLQNKIIRQGCTSIRGGVSTSSGVGLKHDTRHQRPACDSVQQIWRGRVDFDQVKLIAACNSLYTATAFVPSCISLLTAEGKLVCSLYLLLEWK